MVFQCACYAKVFRFRRCLPPVRLLLSPVHPSCLPASSRRAKRILSLSLTVCAFGVSFSFIPFVVQRDRQAVVLCRCWLANNRVYTRVSIDRWAFHGETHSQRTSVNPYVRISTVNDVLETHVYTDGSRSHKIVTFVTAGKPKAYIFF